MRFLALLKKELRECLPWMVSAAVFLLIFGSYDLRSSVRRADEYEYYQYRVFERYSEVWGFELANYPLEDVGSLVFVSAVVLGLALGVRQFWVADFTGTWGFTLHRSAQRTTILAAKICAALISLIAAVGLVLCYLFWRASLPDYSPVPPPLRFLIGGWLVCGVGLLFYLGAGLVGLSKARWYTTKLAGLGFAIWMFFTFTQQWTVWWSFGTLVIGAGILLYLMWETFLKREF
jgi:hypothetical protein